MASQRPATFSAILAHVTHFLTIAIHVILSERNVYPPQSFITARAYNFPVRQNRYPGVCQWIQSAVAAVRDQIAKGAVARVAVAIAHPVSCDILERFVFDLHKLPVVPREEFDTPIERTNASSSELHNSGPHADQDPRAPGGAQEHELIDLTEQFRAALSALSTCSQRLSQIPKGCTFTVAVELRDEADPPLGHPQPWIPTQPELQRRKGSGEDSGEGPSSSDEGLYGAPEKTGREREQGRELGGQNMVPLRSVDVGEVTFELWAEEGTTKSSLTEQDFTESTESSFQSI